MNKYNMREWVSSLEMIIDNKLRKWKKESKIEDGESVKLRWSWEVNDIHLDIFWEDGKETVKLAVITPRGTTDKFWHGLNDSTFNKVQDRVGNLVQTIMHPPLDTPDSYGRPPR